MRSLSEPIPPLTIPFSQSNWTAKCQGTRGLAVFYTPCTQASSTRFNHPVSLYKERCSFQHHPVIMLGSASRKTAHETH